MSLIFLINCTRRRALSYPRIYIYFPNKIKLNIHYTHISVFFAVFIYSSVLHDELKGGELVAAGAAAISVS